MPCFDRGACLRDVGDRGMLGVVMPARHGCRYCSMRFHGNNKRLMGEQDCFARVRRERDSARCRAARGAEAKRCEVLCSDADALCSFDEFHRRGWSRVDLQKHCSPRVFDDAVDADCTAEPVTCGE